MSAGVEYRWFGTDISHRMTEGYPGVMDAVGVFLLEKWREKIGIQGPPRSEPGEPPHMDTQYLRDSATYTVSPTGEALSLGSPAEYLAFLEIGTAKMRPRPSLGPTIQENAQEAMNLMRDLLADAVLHGSKPASGGGGGTAGSAPAGGQGGPGGGPGSPPGLPAAKAKVGYAAALRSVTEAARRGFRRLFGRSRG